MLPEFNIDGNLPEGIYTIGEEEFFNSFSTGSGRRKWLGRQLHELFRLAKLTGKVKRVFVWGSFISSKEYPNDVDLLLLMNVDFQLEEVSEECKCLFNYGEARVRFNADIFGSKSSIDSEILKLWLDTYQNTKDFKRRGIVEVKLL